MPSVSSTKCKLIRESGLDAGGKYSRQHDPSTAELSIISLDVEKVILFGG